jgi:CelD/BcsL family acetyltransferase involved in cellulose biosynthesis
MNVREINSFKALAAQRLVWSQLWSRTAGVSFFHSFDWFAAYWRHYGQQQRLRALLVTDASGPIGLVPLVVRSEPTRLGAVRVLTYPLHDWGSFYGPLGADPSQILATALAHIRSGPRDWDLLDLRWIDPLTDAGATLAAMQAASLTADEHLWAEAAVIETANGWDSYWRSRTSQWRNNVNRCEKKLALEGNIRYERYRASTAETQIDPRWDLYETCVAVAGRSWQSTATDGTTLTHRQIQQFLRDSHQAATDCGAIDINLLFIDQRPAAFAYNYAQRGWVFGLRTGFDSCLSRAGTGTVLLARMIRDSFERGDRLIDLGAGYLQPKRYWQTSVRPIHRCTHFPPGAPKAQLLRLKRWLSRPWRSKQAPPSNSHDAKR